MPGPWQMAYALNQWSPMFPSRWFPNEYGPSSKSGTFYSTINDAVLIGAADAELEEPSYTMVAWEHKYPLPRCNFLQPSSWLTSPPDDENLRNHFHFLHRSGCNTVWVDGHTKRYSYGQLRRPMFSCQKSIYSN